MHICIQCGKEYSPSPKAPKSFYCGNACKQSAYRDRKAQKARKKRETLDSGFKKFLDSYGITSNPDLERFATFQRKIGVENMFELMMLMLRFAKMHQNYTPK